MASLMLDIADAVVVALNAASVATTLSQTFTSTRAYTPRADLKDLGGTLVVSVVPVSSTAEVINRGGKAQETYDIDVAVQKRSTETDPDDDPDVFDPIVLLSEEIQTLLHGATLTAGGVILNCMESPDRPTFIHEHVTEYRQLTAVVRLQYMGVR